MLRELYLKSISNSKELFEQTEISTQTENVLFAHSDTLNKLIDKINETREQTVNSDLHLDIISRLDNVYMENDLKQELIDLHKIAADEAGVFSQMVETIHALGKENMELVQDNFEMKLHYEELLKEFKKKVQMFLKASKNYKEILTKVFKVFRADF